MRHVGCLEKIHFDSRLASPSDVELVVIVAGLFYCFLPYKIDER